MTRWTRFNFIWTKWETSLIRLIVIYTLLSYLLLFVLLLYILLLLYPLIPLHSVFIFICLIYICTLLLCCFTSHCYLHSVFLFLPLLYSTFRVYIYLFRIFCSGDLSQRISVTINILNLEKKHNVSVHSVPFADKIENMFTQSTISPLMIYPYFRG